MFYHSTDIYGQYHSTPTLAPLMTHGYQRSWSAWTVFYGRTFLKEYDNLHTRTVTEQLQHLRFKVNTSSTDKLQRMHHIRALPIQARQTVIIKTNYGDLPNRLTARSITTFPAKTSAHKAYNGWRLLNLCLMYDWKKNIVRKRAPKLVLKSAILNFLTSLSTCWWQQLALSASTIWYWNQHRDKPSTFAVFAHWLSAQLT